MIIFNFIGVGMCIAAFGIAYVVGYPLGIASEDGILALGAPFLLVFDILYRSRKRTSGVSWNVAEQALVSQWWFHHKLGGQFFFLPVWAWGLFYSMLGTYRFLLAAH